MTVSKSFNISKYFSEDTAITNIATGVQPVGTQIYSTIDSLPLSGVSAGAQAYVQENNRLYLWTGVGWYNIALINNTPTISGVDSGGYILAKDGTPLQIIIDANDPEGIPITYNATSDDIGNTATLSQDSSVFTITPSTDENDEGSFSVTFTASDGVNLASILGQFTLSFATWSFDYNNITTGVQTYDLTNHPNAGTETAFESAKFSDDGTILLATGQTNDYTYIYSLSTPWDLNTVSPDGFIASRSVQTTSTHFGLNGTKFYFLGSDDIIEQYTLSTPYDVTTATSDSVTLTTKEAFARDLSFSPNGKFLAVGGSSTDIVEIYYLSTAWDLSTAGVADGTYTPEGENDIQSIMAHPDGLRFWYSIGNTVIEFTTDTAWKVDPTKNNVTKVGTVWTVPVGSTIEGLRWNNDGTKIYYIETENETLYEHSLSTPYDLSTVSASAIATFNYEATTGAGDRDFTFKDDGTKFYIISSTTDTIHEFTLTTPWDISTVNSSPTASLNISGQATAPISMEFAKDGSSVYLNGTNATFHKVPLSTPWDLLTAQVSSSADYDTPQTGGETFSGNCNGFVFNEDGSELVLILGSKIANITTGVTTDGTTWIEDINTTFEMNYYSSTISIPNGYFIKYSSTGTKLYRSGTFAIVEEYDLGSGIDHKFTTGALSSLPPSIANSFDFGGLRSGYMNEDGTLFFSTTLAGVITKHTTS